jgi:hypothetical protein
MLKQKTESFIVFKKWLRLIIKFSLSLIFFEFLCFLLLQIYFEDELNLDFDTGHSFNDWQKTRIKEFTSDTMDFRNFDSKKGWVNRPNERIVQESANQKIVYSINSSGFRSTREYTPTKKNGITRLMVMGNSFVFGSEVDDANCWASILESSNKNLEVLNAGVAGYGLDQAFLLFEETKKEWKPDVVIICYMTMLLQRHVVTFQSFGSKRSVPCSKPRYLLDGDKLILEANPLPSKEHYKKLLDHPNKIIPEIGKHDFFFNRDFSTPVKRNFSFIKIINLAMNRYINSSNFEDFYKNGYYNENSEAFKVTEKIIPKFVNAVKGIGAEPIVVIFPTRIDLTRLMEIKEYKVYEPLLNSLDITGISYLDMASVFNNEKVENLFEKNGHYSPLGNLLVANKIQFALEGKGSFSN